MVAYCALRCAIVLALLCRMGASLIYSGDPRYRISEQDTWQYPEDRAQCNETGWRLLDHGDLRGQYADMIVRMQGKRLLFAGDSLMDMIFHPFVCGAVATGWQMSAMPVGTGAPCEGREEKTAGCMAQMFTKENHKPIVMGFMRFYNYKRGRQGDVNLDDVFRFPIKGENSNFDVLFMNMAHNAMYPPQDRRYDQKLANQMITSAHRATNVGRVVFLGHTPQHFKTESGAYTGPETGDCMCHDKAAMEKQPVFGNNQILQDEVRNENARSDADGKIAFASPWDYYADKCTSHGHLYGHSSDVDCTHWLDCDVASHAPFLKDLVATAGL